MIRPDARLPLLTLLFVTGFVPSSIAQRSDATLAPSTIFTALGAREGMTICEMGAGDGELSIAVARVVGSSGRVLASELGEARVKALQEKVAASRLEQITVVAGAPTTTNFPEGACDALFMRNVYHHFADPAAMDASIVASLKPGGRAVVVDFIPPAQEAPTPADRDKDGMHGVSSESVGRELKAAGLEVLSTDREGDRWFMVTASKAGSGRDPRSRPRNDSRRSESRTGISDTASWMPRPVP